MTGKDILLIVILFFGVAGTFIGVGLQNHGHRLGWAVLAAGVAAIAVAYRGLRK